MAIERISIEIKSNAKNVESQLRDVDNRIKELKNNKPQLEIKAEKLQNAKKEINNINVQLKELAAKKAIIKADSSNVVDAKKKMAEITTQMDKLRARKAVLQVTAEKLKGADTQLNKLNREMNQLNNKKAKLQVDSAEIQVAAVQLDALRNKFRTLETAGQGMVNFGRSLNRYVTLPLIAATAATAKAAIDWEDNFAGVTKTNDEVVDSTGKIIYGYEQLEKDLRDLALEIPLSNSHEEIAKIAENAGQLGIATENVKAFSKVMADLGVTTNMTAETASTELARFANITGLDPSNYDRLGSTIVDLGNKFATTESEISAMSLRLSGAGTVVGMSEADIMGLSAALSSVGIKSEMGGSAISKLMVNMQLASAKGQDAFAGLQDIAERNGVAWSTVEQAVANGGKELTNMSNALGLGKSGLKELYQSADDARSSLEDFAWIAGMSGDEFAQAFQTDAVGAIAAFVDGLSQAEDRGTTAIEMLDEMGIKEVRLRDALLRAGGASELFASAIQTSNTAWEENTALTEEAEKRYETTASQLNLLKAEVRDIAIDLGGPLIEAIRSLLSNLKPTLKNISEMAKKFNKADDSTKKLAGAILGITVAIGPAFTLTGKFTTVIGKLGQIMLKSQSSATAAAGGFSSLGTAASVAAGGGGVGAFTAALSPLGIALLAIVGVGGTLALGYGAWKAFGEEAYNAGQRVKRWGTDVGEATDKALTEIKDYGDDALGSLGLMEQGISANTETIAGDFAKMGESIENHLTKKIETLKESINDFPDDVKEAYRKIADAEISDIEKQKTIVVENNTEIGRIRENAQSQGRDLNYLEANMIKDLSTESINAYVASLKVSETEQQAILASLTGNVKQATKEQAKEWLMVAGVQKQATTIEYNKKIETETKRLVDAGYAEDSKFVKDAIGLLEQSKQNALEPFNSRQNEILANYQDLSKEVMLSNGQTISSTQEMANALATENQKVADDLKNMYTANALIAAENAKKLELKADQAKESGKFWNELVFDSKTMDVKSNAQDEVNKAAESEAGWNRLLFASKDADLSSNAKLMIAEAAIANNRWENMSFTQQQALIESNSGKMITQALQAKGDWEKMTFEQKKAVLYSDTPEVMAETMVAFGLWDAYEAEIKELDADNYNFLSILAASEEKLSIWNAEDPEVKKIIGDDYDFLTTIYSSEEKLAAWNSEDVAVKKLLSEDTEFTEKIYSSERLLGYWNKLPVEDKKLTVQNPDLLNVITMSEEAYRNWLRLPDGDKKILADNTDLLQKIILSDSAYEKWMALPDDEKKIKADNNDLKNKLANSKEEINTYNQKKVDPKEVKVNDQATSVLQGIKNQFDALTDKEIEIGVKYTVTGDKYVQGQGGKVLEAGNDYMGGLIPEKPQYRAGGGEIRPVLFKKKGTDTIPTMLTAGEFVQRKAAVGKFGVDFMNKVNNLDVSGAFKAMTNRFGSQHALQTASVSTVVNNINQTTNNANKVTQNVTGGNPDYIMKRAGRYLR
ncbi:phage tail tape measure protein [Enterococcus larvae]|uniref:phage tail tape measure protein n=1 Tax=Enterococcus larvae TaxID=2794352 RepID=UPI003F2A47BE